MSKGVMNLFLIYLFLKYLMNNFQYYNFQRYINIIWKRGICLFDIDLCEAKKAIRIAIKLGEKMRYVSSIFYSRYLVLPIFSHYSIDTNTDVSIYNITN